MNFLKRAVHKVGFVESAIVELFNNENAITLEFKIHLFFYRIMNLIFTTNFCPKDIFYLFLYLKYMMNPRKELDQMFFPIFERDFFRLKYIF